MKVKKQNKEETKSNKIIKKKIKKDIVSKVEVTNGGGGNVIKKSKKENKEVIVNGKNSTDGNKKKKNKLEKIVEKTDAVENINNAKKGKKSTQPILVKPVTSLKDVTISKNSDKKLSLKPDMTSSELLRTLNSTIFGKKNDDQEKPSKKNKLNSKKSEDVSEPLVKSKKIIEISNSNEVKQNKNKKLKARVEQPKKEIAQPLVKSKKIVEISDSNEVKPTKNKKLKRTVEQPQKEKGEPLVKSKKIAEISDSSEVKKGQIKKQKPEKIKNVLKVLESLKNKQNDTEQVPEAKTKKLGKKNNSKPEEVEKNVQQPEQKRKINQKDCGESSDVKNKQFKKADNKPMKSEKMNKDSQKLEIANEGNKNIANADSGGKKKTKQNNKTKKANNEGKLKTKSDDKEENEIADSKKNQAVVKKQKFGKADKVKKIEKKKPQNVLGMNQRLVPSLKDASKFDERSFNEILNVDNIEKTVEILTNLVKKETDTMKNVIFKDYRYVLNLALFKIPSAPKRIVKLNVKHSIVASDDDVLFIVKDLKRGARIDYEPTKHHYEDLLRDRGIEGIKAVMPFNQLKKEYSSYEMKRKLSNLYDYFICDGSIAGHVFGFLGKIFASKSRGILYSVRVDGKDLKKEIKKALYKTGFRQGAKGDVVSIIVGNHTQSAKQIAENCVDIVEQLKTLLPGGHPNIRNVTIKCNLKGTSGLPLYLSMGQPPKNTPYVIGAKEQKLNKLKDRAEEILAKFAITNTGSIEKITPEEILQRKRKRDEIKSEIEAKKLKSIENGEETEVKSKNKKKEKKNKKKDVEIESEQDESEMDDPDFELNNSADLVVSDSGDDESDDDEDDDDEDGNEDDDDDEDGDEDDDDEDSD